MSEPLDDGHLAALEATAEKLDANAADADDVQEAMDLRRLIEGFRAQRAEITEMKMAFPTEHCPECNAPASYCGEMSADGPTLDCEPCQLRDRIAELEAENKRLRKWLNQVSVPDCSTPDSAPKTDPPSQEPEDAA